jgi:hypothetical protein
LAIEGAAKEQPAGKQGNRNGPIYHQAGAAVLLRHLLVNQDGGIAACYGLRITVEIARCRAFVAKRPSREQPHSVAVAFELQTSHDGLVKSLGGTCITPTGSLPDAILNGMLGQFDGLIFVRVHHGSLPLERAGISFFLIYKWQFNRQGMTSAVIPG